MEESKIIDFYVSSKLSEAQISERLSVEPRVIRKILDKNNITRRTRSEAIRYLYITKFNKRPFVLKKKLSLREQQLKIAGTMLYWGEGSKKGNTVALANSDPDMIRTFISFLKKICGVDPRRIRAIIHYYNDHNPGELIEYWSRVTKIPRAQFYKPFLHKKARGTYRAKSNAGTISIQYSDKKLLEIINSWIRDYQRKLK